MPFMKNLPGMMSRRAGLAGVLIVGAAMLAAPGAASAAEALNCPKSKSTTETKTILDLSADGGIWTLKDRFGEEKLHVKSFALTELAPVWKAAGTLNALFEGDYGSASAGAGHFSGEVHVPPEHGLGQADNVAVVTIHVGGMPPGGQSVGGHYYFASYSGTFDANSNTITGTYYTDRASDSGVSEAGKFVMTKDVPHKCRPVT
jgi:hypothetical protein